LPAAADLVAGPWLACLPGSVTDTKSDSVGVNLDPRVPADTVPDDRFVVVRTPDNKTFLLFRGRKHRVPADAVLVALGAASVAPVRAPAMWLAGLPDGPSLEPATIPRTGSPGPQIGGQQYAVGTLFRQQPTSGEEQLFVLREDGLAPLNRMEFVLLEAAAPGSKPVRLDTAALVAAQRSADRSLTARLPDLTAAR